MIKTKLKTTILTILILCLSVAPCGTLLTMAAQPGSVAPLYNNTSSTISAMSINDSGVMTISYRYTGYPSKTTKAVITTYIEKKTLGLFWKRVDIGTEGNEWIDTIIDYKYSGSRTFKLASKGTYKVTISYKIYGSGGAADIIPYEKTDNY